MNDDQILAMFRNEVFSAGEGAALMAEPGISRDTCASQIRAFQQRNLIHPEGEVRRSGRTAHKLYSYGALGVAKVLSLLTADFSMADNDMFSSVAAHLYGWPLHNPSNDCGWRHPIEAALAGTIKGEYWVFRLDMLRVDESGINDVHPDLQPGTRLARAYIYDLDKGLAKDRAINAPMPRGSVTMHLNLPFKRLSRNVAGAN